MINSIQARTPILALILFVFAVGYTVAATSRVVIIPMGTDSAPHSHSLAVFESGEQTITITAPKAVRTLILTAPSNGIVIVNSTVRAHENSAGDGLLCSINSSKAAIFIPAIDPEHFQGWESAGPLGSSAQLAGTRGFNVTGGSKYYFRLICNKVGSSSDATAADSSLTAIFTPSA